MALGVRVRLADLQREWREARRRHPRTVVSVGAAFLFVATASVVGCLWFLTGLRAGLPDQAALSRMADMDQATAVFDNTDQLAFTIYKEQRIEAPLSEVSPNLIHALIAIEDQRFYDHRGFDLVRMASAAVANVRHRRRAQGGSTITQQLARQSFLTPDKTLHRKFQELILAARIEGVYAKSQILELYLNKVYFGDGLYGVEAASRGYFDGFGWQRVYQGGLRVFSTIDMPMQLAAETAIAEQIAAVEARRAAWQARRAAARKTAAAGKPVREEPSDPLQAALVAMEP